jgi:hypothetical protein
MGTKVYQFEIDADLWDEWAATVEDCALHDRLKILIAEDLENRAD